MIAATTIVIAGDSTAGTMTAEDWTRMSSTASAVDNRMPSFPDIEVVEIRKKRAREYWKPKFERMHHKGDHRSRV